MSQRDEGYGTPVSLCISSVSDFDQTEEELPRIFQTQEELDNILSEIPKEDMIHDGLDQTSLDYISVSTQAHIGVVGIKPGKEDMRHNNSGDNWKRFTSQHYHGDLNEYFAYESATPPQCSTPIPKVHRHQHLSAIINQPQIPTKPLVEGEKEVYFEPCGVHHSDHFWSEQGICFSKTMALSHSVDLMGGSSYITSSSLKFMQDVNLYVQECPLPKVFAAFPQEYDQIYCKTYRATALSADKERHSGFHCRQVIVHKQPIHQHMGGGDSGFCATFCTRSFEGGYLVFADLSLVFYY